MCFIFSRILHSTVYARSKQMCNIQHMTWISTENLSIQDYSTMPISSKHSQPAESDSCAVRPQSASDATCANIPTSEITRTIAGRRYEDRKSATAAAAMARPRPSDRGRTSGEGDLVVTSEWGLGDTRGYAAERFICGAILFRRTSRAVPGRAEFLRRHCANHRIAMC